MDGTNLALGVMGGRPFRVVSGLVDNGWKARRAWITWYSKAEAGDGGWDGIPNLLAKMTAVQKGYEYNKGELICLAKEQARL